MDPVQINVESFSVPIEDAEEFFSAIESALAMMSCQDLLDVFLFSPARQGVAISFDDGWQPFLGFGAGNNPVGHRAPLRSDVKILKRITSVLTSWNHDTPGGRVFITKDSAKRVIDNLPHLICNWEWEGDDPLRRVGEIHARLLGHRNCV